MIGIAMLSLNQPAWAACERELKALEAAQGEAVVGAFTKLSTCDGGKAGEAFPAAVKRSGDVVALTNLAVAAIGVGQDAAVHGMLELVPDYAAREETARAIGGKCVEDAKVEAFVVGLHDALKDRAFVGWAGALRACPSEALTAKLEDLAAAPPDRAFDDKYATVVELYARKRGAAALPVLKDAGIGATGGGPFVIVVDAMSKAVTPEGIGGEPAPADRDALVAALGELAGATTNADELRRLANAMVAVDAAQAAGALLPKLYPDRVQSDGSFLYGVVATETCEDASVVHWAVVEDHGKRWSVSEALDGPVQGFKHKLKCGAAWAVQVTPEPVASEDEIGNWAEGLVGEGGKLKAEKTIVLK